MEQQQIYHWLFTISFLLLEKRPVRYVPLSFATLPFFEGEAPRAWLGEGATQAPIIEKMHCTFYHIEGVESTDRSEVGGRNCGQRVIAKVPDY
jgi:hypothetical protein